MPSSSTSVFVPRVDPWPCRSNPGHFQAPLRMRAAFVCPGLADWNSSTCVLALKMLKGGLAPFGVKPTPSLRPPTSTDGQTLSHRRRSQIDRAQPVDSAQDRPWQSGMWPAAPIQLRHGEATRDPGPPLRLPIRPRSSPIAPAASAGWPCRRTHGCSKTLGSSLGLFVVSSGYPVGMSKRINRRNNRGALVPLQSALRAPRNHSCQQVDEPSRQGIRGHGDSTASPCDSASSRTG